MNPISRERAASALKSLILSLRLLENATEDLKNIERFRSCGWVERAKRALDNMDTVLIHDAKQLLAEEYQ